MLDSQYQDMCDMESQRNMDLSPERVDCVVLSLLILPIRKATPITKVDFTKYFWHSCYRSLSAIYDDSA